MYGGLQGAVSLHWVANSKLGCRSPAGGQAVQQFAYIDDVPSFLRLEFVLESVTNIAVAVGR